MAHQLRLWDVVSASRVDHFVANSTTVQRRIEKIYRMPSEVVSPPVSIERFQVTNQSSGYFLSVGRLVGYKRADLVIEACKLAKIPLKVVGTGPEEEAFKKLAKDASWIEFPGRVSDEELNQLYAEAEGFIFAAEEDAGIVPVEALACGKPVIAYGRGGVTDVVEDGVTGILFAEQKVESVVDALDQFKKTNFNSQHIRTTAERFTKAIFQEKMRNIIEFQS
jgi:glycosyltransferase involved in cell wall biosynthesis